MKAENPAETSVPTKPFLRLKISSMLWLTTAIAAFLGGRVWETRLQNDWRTPIALTGLIDVDGDGLDDKSKLKQMIQKNGGRVVSNVDSSTRFLVLGDLTNSHRETNQDVASARKNRVLVVTVRELFDWLGIQGSKPVTRDMHTPTFRR